MTEFTPWLSLFGGSLIGLAVDLHFNLGLWHFARERYTPIETQCRGVSIGV